jgi:hypothetical protein
MGDGMKSVLLSLLMACCQLEISTLATAQSLPTHYESAIPLEVSAVLTSSGYSQIMSKLMAVAANSGLALRISGFEVARIGNATFAYVHIATQANANFKGTWSYSGAVIGHILYGPMGEVYTDGVYYKPAENPPGGASVGNH